KARPPPMARKSIFRRKSPAADNKLCVGSPLVRFSEGAATSAPPIFTLRSLHLIETHFVPAAIVKLRRVRRGVVRHRGSHLLLQRAAVLQIRRVIADLGIDLGRAVGVAGPPCIADMHASEPPRCGCSIPFINASALHGHALSLVTLLSD